VTRHCDRRFIAAPAEQVFDLIADVERYPEFLPIWRSARIYEEEPNVYFTLQEVGFGPIRERFRTRTELSRPHRIHVTSPDPLFHAFSICWTLSSFRGGCKVGIELIWQMRSRPLQRAIDLFLPTVASTMVDAFEKRARQVLVG
jgi:coenzyme Q-binding protein COQ10